MIFVAEMLPSAQYSKAPRPVLKAIQEHFLELLLLDHLDVDVI